MSKITQVWWYSTMNDSCPAIGIVKCHDDITGEDRFYIGPAKGLNEKADAENIKDYGDRFNPKDIK